MKTCNDCGQARRLEDFHRNRRSKDGRHGRCKDCQRVRNQAWREANPGYKRAYYGRNRERLIAQRKAQYRKDLKRSREHNHKSSLKRKYGLTPDEYVAMFERQDYKCAICKREIQPRSGVNGAHVDHDHMTGAVRAILCHPCNVTLGLVREDEEILRSMIRYIHEGMSAFDAG